MFRSFDIGFYACFWKGYSLSLYIISQWLYYTYIEYIDIITIITGELNIFVEIWKKEKKFPLYF